MRICKYEAYIDRIDIDPPFVRYSKYANQLITIVRAIFLDRKVTNQV